MERSWAASGDTVTDEFAGWKSAIPDHWDPEDPKADVTAVVNSIDRSTEDRAPNRCLPFDGIGARHPG